MKRENRETRTEFAFFNHSIKIVVLDNYDKER